MAGATSYIVEVEIPEGNDWELVVYTTVTGTSYTFDFPGVGQGRWQVFTVKGSVTTGFSPWFIFYHTL